MRMNQVGTLPKFQIDAVSSSQIDAVSNAVLKSQKVISGLVAFRKATYLIQPLTNGLTLHMQFGFNNQTSTVAVTGWWLLDGHGSKVNLSALSYDDVQYIAAEMADELLYQTENFYFELESIYYGGI